MTLGIIFLVIFIALVFEYINGFHDTANSIATVVSTGVLKPLHAVAWAAFFNVAAVMVFQLKVAATIGKDVFLQLLALFVLQRRNQRSKFRVDC